MSAKTTRRLTSKQEAFVHAIADGLTQWAAYQKVYAWNGERAGGEKRASEELDKPHVAARLAQLRERTATRKTLDRQTKREMLAAYITREEPKGKELDPDRVRAIEVDNRMAGHNEPEKLKVSGMGSLLQKIRASSPKP